MTAQAASALLRFLVVCLLLVANASAHGGTHGKHTQIVWGRDARRAIAAAHAAAVPAGVSTAAAAAGGLLIPSGPDDPDLGFDLLHKQALYSCSGLAVTGAGAAAAHKAAAGIAGLPLSSAAPGGPDPSSPALAFKLHSRPGVPRVLLLDFTGHTTVNSVWNKYYTQGNQAIVSPPYDTDGDPTTFSELERRSIIAIWRAVAEDFAPFEVDVTTEETDGQGVALDLAGRGARVVIGGASQDWATKQEAGGLSYTNTFGKPYYQPSFVFPRNLANSSTKHIWEAASHELGHALGLQHDGQGKNPYYWGADGWAQIMGAGYKQPVTQWSRGEYFQSSNPEDDLAIIASWLPLRRDDHSSTTAGATPLRSRFPVAGNIERSDDVDWFSFDGGAGTANITLALVPDAAGAQDAAGRSNLRARVAVRAACATSALARWEPRGALVQGRLRVQLPAAGRYFVSVLGSGDTARNGTVRYSSYGSLGEYRLTVQHPPAPVGFQVRSCRRAAVPLRRTARKALRPTPA